METREYLAVRALDANATYPGFNYSPGFFAGVTQSTLLCLLMSILSLLALVIFGFSDAAGTPRIINAPPNSKFAYLISRATLHGRVSLWFSSAFIARLRNFCAFLSICIVLAHKGFHIIYFPVWLVLRILVFFLRTFGTPAQDNVLQPAGTLSKNLWDGALAHWGAEPLSFSAETVCFLLLLLVLAIFLSQELRLRRRSPAKPTVKGANLFFVLLTVLPQEIFFPLAFLFLLDTTFASRRDGGIFYITNGAGPSRIASSAKSLAPQASSSVSSVANSTPVASVLAPAATAPAGVAQVTPSQLSASSLHHKHTTPNPRHFDEDTEESLADAARYFANRNLGSGLKYTRYSDGKQEITLTGVGESTASSIALQLLRGSKNTSNVPGVASDAALGDSSSSAGSGGSGSSSSNSSTGSSSNSGEGLLDGITLTDIVVTFASAAALEQYVEEKLKAKDEALGRESAARLDLEYPLPTTTQRSTGASSNSGGATTAATPSSASPATGTPSNPPAASSCELSDGGLLSGLIDGLLPEVLSSFSTVAPLIVLSARPLFYLYHSPLRYSSLSVFLSLPLRLKCPFSVFGSTGVLLLMLVSLTISLAVLCAVLCILFF